MRISKNGFTIVELLIVIVVIAILAAISIVAYNGVQARAKDASLTSMVNQIKKSIEKYNAETGSYPKAADWGAMGLNDDTGVWPQNNMGLSPQNLKSPLDNTSALTSMSEGSLSQNHIQYISIIRDQTPSHWTCYQNNDVCVGYALRYVKSDGTVVNLDNNFYQP